MSPVETVGATGEVSSTNGGSVVVTAGSKVEVVACMGNNGAGGALDRRRGEIGVSVGCWDERRVRMSRRMRRKERDTREKHVMNLRETERTIPRAQLTYDEKKNFANLQ